MSRRTLDLDAPRRLLAEPGIGIVLAALAMDGEETRLVGGCVRDALLGRPVSDIDLATTLLPTMTVARAKSAGLRSIPTGIAHGTVTLLAAGTTFEVTTLREDIETDGRHAIVRFGRDFARDADRRDFTINAMAVAADGSLHDTTGGASDLAAGRVRFIGEAATRIREDALRILRFFRFHARYGHGAPDPEGLDACIAARDALDGLSRERIRAEFLKLLVAPGVLAVMAILSETGLLSRLIGGIGDLGRLTDLTSADAERPSFRPPAATDQETHHVAIERLAALAVFSTNDADRLRASLRLSKAEYGLLTVYATSLAALLSHAAIDRTEMRRLAAVHGVAGLTLAVGAIRGHRRPRIAEEAIECLGRMVRGDLAVPVLPVTGADLIARGVPAGPEVGRRLALARRFWLELGCPEGDGAREILLARATA